MRYQCDATLEGVEVRFINNATVVIQARSGASVLCDPWFTEGAFLGSWFHWPPLNPVAAEGALETRFDAIFVSHLHPDHFDRRFLSRYLKRHPGTPVLIPQFPHPWLERGLRQINAGTATVVGVDAFEGIDLGGLHVRAVPSDICDPRVCGARIPCTPEPWRRGIDAVGVFSADGKVVCNANDALTLNVVPRLARAVGKVDMLLGHWGFACAFPQCFPEVENTQALRDDLVQRTCGTLEAAAKALGADVVMPFAGQYMLGGRLAPLNPLRAAAPPTEGKQILERSLDARVVTLNPGEAFDLNTGDKGEDYLEPDHATRDAYIARISAEVFPYEKAFGGGRPFDKAAALRSALEPVKARASQVAYGRWNCITLETVGEECSLVMGPDGVRLSPEPLLGCDSMTRISIPEDLLWQLTRKRRGYDGFTTVHWNQAEIGSHMTWFQEGSYDRSAQYLLNFFGT